MSTSPFDRSCLGFHCSLRDKCKHHKLPTQMHNQFFQPPEVGESCSVFELREPAKPRPWGMGREDEND